MYVHSPLKEKRSSSNLRSVDTGNGSALPNGQPQATKKPSSSAGMKPWKIILGALIIGTLGMLYLTHVFTTQSILEEVQQLERQYDKARRIHAERKLNYDRLIGPTNIYPMAKEQGFINAGPVDRVLIIEER